MIKGESWTTLHLGQQNLLLLLLLLLLLPLHTTPLPLLPLWNIGVTRRRVKNKGWTGREGIINGRITTPFSCNLFNPQPYLFPLLSLTLSPQPLHTPLPSRLLWRNHLIVTSLPQHVLMYIYVCFLILRRPSKGMNYWNKLAVRFLILPSPLKGGGKGKIRKPKKTICRERCFMKMI